MKINKTIFAALSLALVLAGCKEGPDYSDAVYMTGTLQSNSMRFLLDGESTIGLTVTATDKVSREQTAVITPNPGLLEEYNQLNGTEYQVPPASSYSFSDGNVTIEPGNYISSPASLTANPDLLEEGVSYCLPVTITSTDGDLRLIESAKTVYVMFTKVVSVKAAYLARSTSFDIENFGGEDSPVRSLGAFTLELKVCPVNWPTASANSASSISTLMGGEENFLFRFGDGAGYAKNRLHLAKASIGTAEHPDQKNHYDAKPDMVFETGQWVHFAAVYDGSWLRIYVDGVQIQAVETMGGTADFSRCYDGHDWETMHFQIGASVGTSSRMFDGMISECRVWNCARSVNELNASICYVDPVAYNMNATSTQAAPGYGNGKGLVAYWRFDGSVDENGDVPDVTGNGFFAKHYGRDIQWADNQKCPW